MNKVSEKIIEYCSKPENKSRKAYINLIFYIIIIVSVIIFIVQWMVAYVSTGYIWELSTFQRTKNVVLDDFFHTNYMVANNDPYFEGLSSYPPFVLVLAKFFALFGDYSQGYSNDLMFSQSSIVFSAVLFYLIFAIVSEVCIIYILKKKNISLVGIIIVSIACFVCLPILYNIERGNYIIYALMFSLIFLALYDSEKFWVREISFISLALAVGIKLYPALFAIVLLKEKRIAELLRCASYSVLIFILSFIVFNGGFSNIERFVEQLSGFSSNMTDYGFNLSLASCIGYVASWGGYELFSEDVIVQNLQTVLPYIVAVIFVIASVFQNRKWKTLFLAAITMVLFPNISFQYAAMFLLIPLLAFVVEDNKDRRDYFYMVLLYLPLMPIALGVAISDGYITWNLVFSDFAMIILGLCLTVEVIVYCAKSLKCFIENKKA